MEETTVTKGSCLCSNVNVDILVNNTVVAGMVTLTFFFFK